MRAQVHGAPPARAKPRTRRALCFNRGVELFPAALYSRPSMSHPLAPRQVLLLLGRDFEAVQAAERAARLEPAWPDGWLTLARCGQAARS
jgi:hypothetical protein